MAENVGLRVTVEGDVPSEVLERIISAVQETVRREVASIDFLGDYAEADYHGIIEEGRTGGIIYYPPEEVES